jgi:divalent metal cation (Fe/Co/Zn/Cd) transporter
MNIIFGAIFIISIALGWGIGYLNQMSLLATIVSIVVAGFIGSSIIALIFSYLYFLQKETDSDKVERLKQEINQIKEIKQIEE